MYCKNQIHEVSIKRLEGKIGKLYRGPVCSVRLVKCTAIDVDWILEYRSATSSADYPIFEQGHTVAAHSAFVSRCLLEISRNLGIVVNLDHEKVDPLSKWQQDYDDPPALLTAFVRIYYHPNRERIRKSQN